MIKIKLATLVLFIFVGCENLSNKKDYAYVVDAKTNKPLNGVTVSRFVHNESTYTDSSGMFYFKESGDFMFDKEGYINESYYFQSFNGDTIFLKPEEDTVQVIVTKYNLQNGDTTFLVNELTQYLEYKNTFDVYQSIYIDPNKNSKYYGRVCNFQIDKPISSDTLPIKKKNLPNGLPLEWVPLHQYNNKYYIYAPCEWIISRHKITDSTLLYSSIEGWYGYNYKSIERKTSTHYIIKGLSGNFSPEYNTQHIYIVDVARGIAVFEDNVNEHLTLMVRADKARNFPIIVHNCIGMKQSEFEFETPDFRNILKK